MGLLSQLELEKLRNKLCDDPSMLGKIYKAKKNQYHLKSVEHSLVEDMVRDGWEEYTKLLKTKTKLRKLKSHDVKFEDDIWCQLYELGYRCLNWDQNFKLPFGKELTQRKQIDVIAVNDESILLVECKSSLKVSKAPSFKTEFEGLPQRLNGFRKSLEQIFSKDKKVKYIFATRNLRIDNDSADIQRLTSTNSFFYNDNTFNYVKNLIDTYKSAAHYQFLGILFRGEKINKDRIELPAIEGKMGEKKYYMFSIEPHLLLKIGFILHRTEANELEMPTYQRLLVPKRLKGISSYINQGGYFPNSVILNFNQTSTKLQFEPSSRGGDTRSRIGTLKIPRAFSIAYIIDGQHRLYGYANSDKKRSNTIPVVAFVDLDSTEQLKIFMDINENQKAVSASLRLTLEEDLYWNSNRADSRMKALRSSIIRLLASSLNGPLYKKIQIGEDKAELSSKPFSDALSKSGLLPKAKGNNYENSSVQCALYNTNNHNYEKEMIKARREIVKFINLCYSYAEDNFNDIYKREKYFLISNRGIFPFICLIGSLNKYETEIGNLNLKSKSIDRFNEIKKYLKVFFEQLGRLPKEEEEKLLSIQGAGIETKWLRSFQNLVNSKYPEYLPPELEDWKERQDEGLQEEGRKLGTKIEIYIKQNILKKLKILFKENWDLEIGDIKTQCESRASDEIQRQYKEGLGRKNLKWTDMFFIKDYKTIIEKHWTKRPQGEHKEFKTFEEEFSINVDLGGFNSKAEKLKWISVFNSYRNVWAHEGSRDKRLNKEEVKFLQRVSDKLNI